MKSIFFLTSIKTKSTKNLFKIISSFFSCYFLSLFYFFFPKTFLPTNYPFCSFVSMCQFYFLSAFFLFTFYFFLLLLAIFVSFFFEKKITKSTRNVKTFNSTNKPKPKKLSPEPSVESREESPVPERKRVEPARKKPEPEAEIPAKKKVSVPKIISPEKSEEEMEEEEEEIESSPPRERSGSEVSTEGEVSRLNYEVWTKRLLSDIFSDKKQVL